MAEWFVFNVFLPLIPIFLVSFGLWAFNKAKNIISFVGGGQLYFYCTTLAATAIKDVIESQPNGLDLGNTLTSTTLGGLFFCVIFSTFAYAVAILYNEDEDRSKLAITSLLVTFMTVVLISYARNSFGLV